MQLHRKKSLAIMLLVGSIASAACSSRSSKAAAPAAGSISVVVNAVTFATAVTSVTVEIQPANFVEPLTYNATSGKFEGTIPSIPVGEHTIAATALNSSGDVVGRSNPVSFTIREDETTSVYLAIIDLSGAPGTPDHGPLITSMIVPAAPRATFAEPVSATATDPDGDEVTYSWNALCSLGTIGTFANRLAAETTFTASAPGLCTIRVTVTANGLTHQVTRTITIRPAIATGTAVVNADFVVQPVVTTLTVAPSRSAAGIEIARTAANASLSEPLFPLQVVDVTAIVENQVAAHDPGLELLDNCGGHGEVLDAVPIVGGYRYTARWTAPATPGVCMFGVMATSSAPGGDSISGNTVWSTVADTFYLAANVTGCADDYYEENDSTASAYTLPNMTNGFATGLDGYANDEDWYRIAAGGSDLFGTNLLHLSVRTDPAADISIRIYRGETPPDPYAPLWSAGGWSITAPPMDIGFGATEIFWVAIRRLTEDACAVPYHLDAYVD